MNYGEILILKNGDIYGKTYQVIRSKNGENINLLARKKQLDELTKKEVSINNAIDKYQSNNNSNETIKTTKEEMIEYGNIITDNYLLLLGVSAALIICLNNIVSRRLFF